MSKILIIEEDKDLRENLEKWLTDKNISVIAVDSHDKAREFVKKQKFDLLILDMSYHLEEEIALLKELRENLHASFVPIFCLKDPAQDDTILERSDLPVEDYMSKPLNEKEFVFRVKLRLKRMRDYKRLKRETKKLDALFSIGSILYTSMQLEDAASALLPLVINFLHAKSGAIFLKNNDTGELEIISSHGPLFKGDLPVIMKNISRETLRKIEIKFIPDIKSIPNFARLKLENPRDFSTVLSMPLISGSDVIGALDIYNMPVEIYEDEEWYDFIRSIASEASKMVSLSQKFTMVQKNLQESMEELAMIYEVSDALGSTLNLDELLRLIVRNALRSFDAQVVSLMLINKETNLLEIRYAEGLKPEIIESTRIKLGEGIAGRVAKTGQPLLLVDVMGIDQPDVEKDIKSALSVPLKIKEEIIGVLNVSKTSQYRFTENDLKLLFNLAGLAAQAIEKAELYSEISRSLEEIKESYMSTVKALAGAIEAKDPYTQGHVDRVAKYGLAIAMELDSELLKDDMFRYALVLHDVGKIGVPDSILSKPGPLTEEEREVIEMHPEAGAKIISPVKFLKQAVDMVRYHQERWDGGGYPRGLKGEEIPLVARIIAVADAFDAITSDRPYRKGRDIDYAVAEIKRNSGTQFDPEVVDAFISAINKNLIP
ncbi:MAG: GAF domain-containing protein [Candidatus Eremiobacteraeota bacterium]|nr:GAF domain-containing protein [Candidatus Eremiobacteraeota bacterium]